MRIRSSAIASLAAIVFTGCGGGGGGGSGSGSGSTAPASTTAPGASAPFVVTVFAPASAPAASTRSLTLTFSEALDASTVVAGTTLVALEDKDTNPGGTFAEMAGTAKVDASGTKLDFTPANGFQADHEVRLALSKAIHAKSGKALERGAISSPISFPARLPDAVYEGRFAPLAAGAAPPPTTTPPGTTPPPTTPAPTPSTPGATPAAPPPALATFVPESGTDVWHIDFDLRATTFDADMANHGLRSADAATDALARDKVESFGLSYASQKYNRTADGKSVSGKSWKISFTAKAPGGAGPAKSYSREAVGGEYATNPKVLGVSIYDAGNNGKEDNSRSNQGIFTLHIGGLNSRLTPALGAADKKFLDGTYKLGGSAADDARMVAIWKVCDDFGHALGSIVAHEVGHSVGLAHDESDPKGLMKASTSPTLMSDKTTHFSANSAATLTANLGRSP